MYKEYFWQMTFEEFKEYHFTQNPDSNPFIVEDGWFHQILTALTCGNPVTEEVLDSHSECCFGKQDGWWEIRSK